jgi:ABC-type glycerol-3-phosphate transport system substrate-binding protein
MLGRPSQAQRTKRSLASVLIALSALTLMGCSPKGSESEPIGTYNAEINANPLYEGRYQLVQSQQDLKGTLLVWTQRYQGMEPMLQKMLNNSIRTMTRSFEKMHPEVTVVVEEYPDTVFYQKHQQSLKYGLGADVILVHTLMLSSLTQNNLIKPIPSKVVKSVNFRSRLLAQAKKDGQLYGLPFMVDVQALCYNRDHVKTAPKSLKELKILANNGISTGLSSKFLQSIWGAPGFGAEVFNSDEEPSMNEERWGQWIETQRTLDREPGIVLMEDGQTMRQYFIKEELSLIPCRSHVLPLLREKLGSEKLGMASLPSINGIPAKPEIAGLMLALSPIMSRRQEILAQELLLHMTNPDVQQIMAIEWKALLPVNSKSDFNRHLFPELKQLNEIYENSVAFKMHEWNAIVRNFVLINNSYKQAINGEIKSDTAIQRIKKALKKTMASR